MGSSLEKIRISIWLMTIYTFLIFNEDRRKTGVIFLQSSVNTSGALTQTHIFRTL